jgi:hypothetical protein
MEKEFFRTNDEKEFVEKHFIPTLNHIFLKTHEILKKVENSESRKLLLYFAAEVAVKLYDFLDAAEWAKKPNSIRDKNGYFVEKIDAG